MKKVTHPNFSLTPKYSMHVAIYHDNHLGHWNNVYEISPKVYIPSGRRDIFVNRYMYLILYNHFSVSDNADLYYSHLVSQLFLCRSVTSIPMIVNLFLR